MPSFGVLTATCRRDGMISVSWAYGPSRECAFGCDAAEVGSLPLLPLLRHIRRCHVISQEKKKVAAVPDLREFPLDRLAELGGTPLAHSIALYRERLKENGVPLSSFNARI